MTVANAFRGKRGRKLKLSDFLFNWGGSPRKEVNERDGDSDIDS